MIPTHYLMLGGDSNGVREGFGTKERHKGATNQEKRLVCDRRSNIYQRQGPDSYITEYAKPLFVVFASMLHASTYCNAFIESSRPD